MRKTDQLAAALTAYGAQSAYGAASAPGATRVVGLQRITDGWEAEVYAVRLADHEPADVVLRVYPSHDGAERCAREFAVLKLVSAAGYPVPRPYFHETAAEPLGHPFLVMQRLAGGPLGDALARAEPAVRASLESAFYALLVALHALDRRGFEPLLRPGVPAEAEAIAQAGHTQTAAKLRAMAAGDYLPVLAWLVERAATVDWGALALCHLDYHPNNVLVDAAGRLGVIDWGGAEVADPRMDLGWLVLMAECYDPSGREAVLAGYERAGGGSLRHMEYFEVVASLRRLAEITGMLKVGPVACGKRPGAERLLREDTAAIRHAYERLVALTGRRVPEAERTLRILDRVPWRTRVRQGLRTAYHTLRQH
jgi:aminoglycoside phosphotransferase (APT) family kinase protein